MRGGPVDQPLWTNARVIFDFRSPGSRSSRIITLRRPFGLIGSIVGADFTVADTSVSARHAYLHVDERGVCLIDLASRTGTRVNGHQVDSAWLQIGDVIEIAGREAELLEVHLNGLPFLPQRCDQQLLVDADDLLRVSLALEPLDARGTNWVIGSELIFLGQGETCGIRLPVGSAAKTHCAIVRSSSSAYIVDLLVERTCVNQQPVRRASRINDGDILTVGQVQFAVHIEPYSGEIMPFPRSNDPSAIVTDPKLSLMRIMGSIPTPSHGRPLPLETLPIDSQPSVIAWMLGALQASHGELLRRQNELQDALGRVLKQVNDDSSAAIDGHNERIDQLNQEMEELRRQIASAPTGTPDLSQVSIPEPTPAAPLVEPTTGPPPAPVSRLIPPFEFVGPPAPVSERSRETATWLLQRIETIESKNRFSLWSLFRFGRNRPAPLPDPEPDGAPAPPIPPKTVESEDGSQSLS